MIKLLTFSVFSLLTLNTFANERAVYEMGDAVRVLTSTLETDEKFFVLNRLLDAKTLMKHAAEKLDSDVAQTTLQSAEKRIISLINSTVDTSDTHFFLSHKQVKKIISDLNASIEAEKK